MNPSQISAPPNDVWSGRTNGIGPEHLRWHQASIHEPAHQRFPEAGQGILAYVGGGQLECGDPEAVEALLRQVHHEPLVGHHLQQVVDG